MAWGGRRLNGLIRAVLAAFIGFDEFITRCMLVYVQYVGAARLGLLLLARQIQRRGIRGSKFRPLEHCLLLSARAQTPMGSARPLIVKKPARLLRCRRRGKCALCHE
jgi:hypothetical protein